MVRRSNPLILFYGWWIVVASFFIAVYIGGAVFYGFTAFFEPIIDEMDWSYTQLSLAASLRGLEMGILSPVVGILADRWGPRKLIFGGILVTVASLLLLSSTNSLFMFYVSFVLLSIGVSGCTVTVLLTAVANWFRRKMGIASGIAICGFGFSGVLIPVIVRLIEVYNWRTALIILAAGMIVLVLPLSFVFRHRPEQYGYFPDGQKQDTTAPLTDSSPPQSLDVELKMKQALKNGTFWRIVLARMYHMTTMMAIITHVMPYLSSISISRATSSLVATAIPLISITGRLSFGWLGDKFSKRSVAATSFVMISCGAFCFAYASDTRIWLLVPFLVLLGIGYGGTNAILPALGREYFGRTNFGSIYGLMEGIGTIGAIIGPTLAGWTYDSLGSYQIVWFLLSGLAVVAIVSVLAITPARSLMKPDDSAIT